MKKNCLSLIIVLLASILSTACSPASVAPPGPGATPPVSGPAPTSTSAPSPTPTSQPGKALLVAPNASEALPIQPVYSELLAAAGLVLELKPALQKEDLTPQVKVVLIIDPPPNLNELAGAAPQVQFIAVTSGELPGSANLTVIRQSLEDRAFVAGFVTALLSTDYRAGGLLPADGLLGERLQEAFANGSRYYCGVCAPGWPLNRYYPQVTALPAASDGPAWQAAAAQLLEAQQVEAFYLSPEAARPEVSTYLQGKTQQDQPVKVVGSSAPPAELLPQWAATVRFDLPSALREAWKDVSTGKGGVVIDTPLLVETPTPGLLSAGRLRLVKNLIADLKSRAVYPFSVPAQ